MADLRLWPCYMCKWSSNNVMEMLEHLRDGHEKSHLAEAIQKVKDGEREREELTSRGEEIPARLYLTWSMSILGPETERSEEVRRANRRRHHREGITLVWNNAQSAPHRPTLVWKECRATIAANTDGKAFIIYQYAQDRKDQQNARTGQTPPQYAETIQEARKIAEDFITGEIESWMWGDGPRMPPIQFTRFEDTEGLWVDRR